MGNNFFNYLLVVCLMFLLIFVVAISNSYAGAEGEREKIKDAILNNYNITCVEYLKLEE